MAEGKKNSQNRGKFKKPGQKKDFKPKRSSSSGPPKKHGKKPLDIKPFSALVPGGIPGTGKPKFNRRPEKGWASLGVPANRKPREGDKVKKQNGGDDKGPHRNYQRKRKAPGSDQKLDSGKVVSAKISGKITSQINFAINKDSKKLNANPDSLELGENQFQMETIDDGEPKKKKSKHKRIKITEQKHLHKKADLASLNADMCKFYRMFENVEWDVAASHYMSREHLMILTHR